MSQAPEPAMSEVERASAPVSERASRSRRLVVSTCVTAVICALLGIALGFVWMTLADPPRSFYEQLDFEGEAGVTVWFWIVGLPFSAVVGLVVGLRGERYGALSLIPAVLGAMVAAFVCAHTGHDWFAPARDREFDYLVQAQYVTAKAGISTPLSYLVWLLGALAGYISAAWSWRRAGRSR